MAIIFISQVGWEDVRPPLGASPDPYFIDVPSPTKESEFLLLYFTNLTAYPFADIVKLLISKFPSYSGLSSDNILTNPYHPSLSPLYTHFITMLCDVCYPFCHDPQELQYIAAARWPGFVKPLIDNYKQQLPEMRDPEEDDGSMEPEVDFTPPSEDLRIRLIRFFNPSLTTAMEALLPRLTNATDWALTNEPPENLLSRSRTEAGYQQQQNRVPTALTQGHVGLKSLPRMSKFILIASFLASMNPAKSDLRMFGRGLDEKKRKRRVMKTQRKTKAGAPSKVGRNFKKLVLFSLLKCRT